MDGSSAGKKPAGKKPAVDKTDAPKKKTSKPAEKPEPDNDDPFAVAQSPPAKKVLQCAPKPMKGRLHRVVCPMCDTQGFIPKAAVGRQVRCANKKCMVPVFEAEGQDKERAPQAPARVSDGEADKPRKKPKAPGEKNPMVMYAVVGGVLLALTLGFVAYLNKPGVSQLGPANIPMPDYVENEPEDTLKTEVEVPVVVDYRSKATALVEEMIKMARVTSGNRDKPFCRRLTGDAFLRLGLDTQADAEFAQMQNISRNAGRDTAYYRVGPLVTNYWKQLSAGDQAAADKRLAEANGLAGSIPKSGLLAVATTVSLAAALVESGDPSGAAELIRQHQPDVTVALQLDAARHGAWMVTSATLEDSGQDALAPGEVFLWNEPLKTAVGVQLSARRRWDSALVWINTLSNPVTTADTIAAVGHQMLNADASAETQQTLLAVAEAKDPETALRTVAVLAQGKSPDLWTQAVAKFKALPATEQSIPSDVQSIIDADAPGLATMRHRAAAVTDFAIAAVSHGDEGVATEAIQATYAALISRLAPTAELRRACGELEAQEDKVKNKVAKELRLARGSQQIRARFLAYRRGVDRQANVAEKRRLVLLKLLSRVIRGGGLSAVKVALSAADSGLNQEVHVDELSGLLVVAAATIGESFPEISAGEASLRVPVARVDAVPETKIVRPLVAAWTDFLESSDCVAATKLERAKGLAGVRAANAAYIVEQASLKASSVSQHLASVAQFKDDRWREVCLNIATRILTKRGMLDEIQAQLNEAAKTPTQKLVALYGMVRGAIELAESETPTE